MRQRLNKIYYIYYICFFLLIILIAFKITIYPIISGNHVKYELCLSDGYNPQVIVLHELFKFVVYTVIYSLGIFVLLIRQKNTAKAIPWGELFLVVLSISFALVHTICFVLAYIIAINLNIQIDIFYIALPLCYLYYFGLYPLKSYPKATITTLNIIGWILSILYLITGVLVVGEKLSNL